MMPPDASLVLWHAFCASALTQCLCEMTVVEHDMCMLDACANVTGMSNGHAARAAAFYDAP